MSSPLLPALKEKRVLVCVGAGGVGKTTLAAAMGLHAAQLGRSTLVCTIDPAKRLANSLGLSALGNDEARVPDTLFQSAGLSPGAPLFAMMLDMKQAWDELILRYAPESKRQQILSNRFYRALSSALAGSQEYISLEKLWQLRHGRDYALIVLDTPPTVHAMDFLDAPGKILDFLENDAAKWLLTPALAAGKLGLRLANLGGSFVVKTLARFTGLEMLQALGDFMQAIRGMNEGFRERAKGVQALLASHETGFVLVTAPHPERMQETLAFYRALESQRLSVAAVVVNRVHRPVSPEERAQAELLAEPLKGKLLQTLAEAASLAESERESIALLQASCGSTPVLTVPRADRDVHDLGALWTTGEALLGSTATP
jgi:anion-transporting  ArsA/GET3 family ATPase